VVDNLGYLVGRSYDTFGLLFGVRNYANMESFADRRGIPDELSDRAEERIEKDRDWCHSFTYITYDEIQGIDWDKESEHADSRIGMHVDGEMIFKAAGVGDLSSKESERVRSGEVVRKEREDGKVVEYKTTKLTRRECLSGAWERLIFEIMDSLADMAGPENVRMVVWFDN
jgi:hypothetical protein